MRWREDQRTPPTVFKPASMLTLMMAPLRVLLRVVSKHHPTPRGQQALANQQDVGSRGQLGSCHLVALLHKHQPVKKRHILLCGNTKTRL